MLGLVILVFSVTASALVGLFVISRDIRSLKHRVYAALTLAFILLSIANFFTLEPSPNQLFFIRTVMFASTISVYLLYLFARSVKDPRHLFDGGWGKVLFVATVVMAIVDYTPLLFSELKPASPAQPVPGYGALLYLAHLVLSLGLAAKEFLGVAREPDLLKKRQYKSVLIGLIPILTVAPVTGFVLPILFEKPQFIVLTPIYTLFFVSAVGYAMVRHGLFDIRAATARVVAYGMLLASLTAIYGLGVFSVSSIFFRGREVDLLQGAFQILMAIFVAISFHPLKRFFDHITEKIFLQSDYDIQEVLKRIGSVVSNNSNMGNVSALSLEIIMKVLKSSYAVLFITKGEIKKSTYSKGAVPAAFRPDESESLLRRAVGNEGLILIDEVFDISTNVSTELRSHDVAVVVRLSTTEGTVGYLIIGSKQNGRRYSTKDAQLLATVEDELSLAVQNALRFEEIRSFNRTLQEKVDDATAKLRRTNAKLQELDETKDEFVSMASHQLRTPLTSVKGYLSMVLEGDAGKLNPNQKKLLEEAYAGSQRMVYLISDFLNVSRMKTGKFALDYDNTNLAAVINQEIDQLRVTAEGRNMNFIYEAPDSFPSARLDENKIRQVIMNLIDNAIYYSKPGGTIKVELYTQDNQIVFRVRDNGIGVPAKEQRGLFEKFYRASNARGVRPDGTGLGLFMIKKVILAHGGTIIFNSAENKGSTFGFTLPMKKSTQIKIVNESLQLAKK